MNSFWDGITPQAVSEAESVFGRFAIGENKAYIKMVQEKTSKNGNPMLEITFANDDGAEIKHWIVDNEYKLSNVKNVCMAFGISFEESIYPGKWLYKEGIVICKKDEYNGEERPKVNYFKPLQPIKPNHNPSFINNQQQPRHQVTHFDDTSDEFGNQNYYDDDQFTDNIPF